MSALQSYLAEQVWLMLLAFGLGLAIASYAAVTWLQWAASRGERRA